MTTTCADRHVCEPDYYPRSLGESWQCPECGQRYTSYDVHLAAVNMSDTMQASILRHVPPGTIGWTTRDAR